MIPHLSFLVSFFVLSTCLLATSEKQLEEKNAYLSEIVAEKSSQPDKAKIKVRGTGKTIGDVILLEVTNRDKVNTLRFYVGPALVPGTRRSQPYIIPGSTEIVVLPGGSITVPIDGICIDPHKPPIRPGSGGPKFEDWIDINPLDDDWTPNPGSGWEPDPNNPVLNPITETPIGHTIDIYSYLEEAAPIILTIVESIIKTTDDLFADGLINTPVTNNPTMERELIIQQTVWITISELTGNPYTIEDFESRVIDLIPSTDRPVEGNLEEENVKDDIQDFWGGFKLVGAEAKVLSSSGTGVPIGLSPDKSKEEEEDDREACAVSQMDLNLKLKVFPPDSEEGESIEQNERGEFIVGQLLPGSTIKIECQPTVECECVIITRRGGQTETFRAPCFPNNIEYTSFSSSNLRYLESENESNIHQKLEEEDNDRLERLKGELRDSLANLDAQIKKNEQRINELQGIRDRELRNERDSLITVNRALNSLHTTLAREIRNSNDRQYRNNHAERLNQMLNERKIQLWQENGCNLNLKVQARGNRAVRVNAKVTIVVNGSCGSDHQDRCKSADFSQTFEINIKSR